MILVFNLDDSAPDIHATAVLAKEGLGPLDLPMVRGFVGRCVPHLVDCLMRAHDIDEPACSARLVEDFIGRYDSGVTCSVPYPGVPLARVAIGR